MRTESQIKRKRNELAAQRELLLTRASEAGDEANARRLQEQAGQLDVMIELLDWVLNAPLGSYHA
ncbi:hypothetical protein B5M42_017640 [Paenibacillus athensensis]|uniref:Uncharacterized protein n=1 Tax=Paenibacillus athensensis TaxID=1967502 RepID=A0A4Y8Q3N4_9BACL|nr:hypothetical protein [Paenibacillus athensensis]MCD1260627.1 hypothetical protein [Paenibacillus athensensis]